jgi:hypothetical protein
MPATQSGRLLRVVAHTSALAGLGIAVAGIVFLDLDERYGKLNRVVSLGQRLSMLPIRVALGRDVKR